MLYNNLLEYHIFTIFTPSRITPLLRLAFKLFGRHTTSMKKTFGGFLEGFFVIKGQTHWDPHQDYCWCDALVNVISKTREVLVVNRSYNHINHLLNFHDIFKEIKPWHSHVKNHDTTCGNSSGTAKNSNHSSPELVRNHGTSTTSIPSESWSRMPVMWVHSEWIQQLIDRLIDQYAQPHISADSWIRSR